jgi:cysteine synthase A
VLKKHNPSILTVAVMPVEAQTLKGGPYAPHKIQGIGPSFIPAIYDKDVVDRVFDVTYDQAVDTARRMAKQEGILIGISSGAIAYAAIEIAKELGAGKRVVVVLPDTGERYLSTPLFEYTDLVNQPATTPQMAAAAAK